MVRSFYPWVENPSGDRADPKAGQSSHTPAADRSIESYDQYESYGSYGSNESSGSEAPELSDFVSHEARIAVVDDLNVAPRVSIVDPAPIRDYIEAITQTTYRSAREQGGSIPFMVIREVVENLIHAYFTDPVVTVLPGGNTIRFSDRGPGIRSKEQALEYGTTTATEAMKRYIRGVGSGLPYVLHFLSEKGGSLTIEDNLTSGTVVTMSLEPDVSRETPVRELQMPSHREVNVSDLGELRLDEPERQVLDYLRTHGSGGPTELARLYGASVGTWSRRLARLRSKDLVEKSGQKHYLTALGTRLADLVAGR